MKTIFLNKKTGYFSNDKILILDHKKFTFYSFDFSKKSGGGKFNLPPGRFFLINGEIKPLKNPVKYNLKKLPKRQYYFRSDPTNFKLIIGNNPNKCTIDYSENIIILDRAYLNKSRIITDFIFAHERGHRYYSDEKYADRYAKNYLYKYGYNPSQLLIAPEITLSDRVIERKSNLLNY